MSQLNPYATLQVAVTATQAEIKAAYRRLVKQYHPDYHPSDRSTHERMAAINAAYEILGDEQCRQAYDAQHRIHQKTSQPDIQRSQAADRELEQWLLLTYTPVSRIIEAVLRSLPCQIDALAADPFDDDLMDHFLAYLQDCRRALTRARYTFQAQPNPAAVAKVAAHLYYCLNQLVDGLDELEQFSHSYDDRYLHTGQELFRIAHRLFAECRIVR
ncbi:DnaJ domain-containing protein [Thermosynechococcus sp. HN-54]|uniref:J domain-containing protein n=1 Tax=Thermosynechococcus sp. HN-54 TaxID=2933959 RepID=UPI00202CEF26|nr:J domain-containing protein [Thermosynechococcus sp. HN-54]URR35098.1 DnaJ domain-containing protein [Thermosynechococcus sp. HN-54]